MTARGARRVLNAKTLFFGALKQFRERNRVILPQLQLQHGKSERWLSREFAVAMNCHLAGEGDPRRLQTYADCERGYADISVWRAEVERPLALYEVKALYRGDPLVGVVQKARSQLERSPLAVAENRVGLFFATYCAKGPWRPSAAKSFRDDVRTAIRCEFTSDHAIRMTGLAEPTEIIYAGCSWWTASWVTWGRPR